MKIAVFSDIHDNFHNLNLVLNEIKKRKITTAFCLGDFINPGIIKKIIDSRLTTYTIWGNNDGEKYFISKLAGESKGKMILASTENMEVSIAGKKVFLIHRKDFAKSVAKSGDFDAVFHGDTHIQYMEKLTNGCLLANPGEVSGHVTEHVSFMIWDTEKNEAETIFIKNPLLVTV